MCRMCRGRVGFGNCDTVHHRRGGGRNFNRGDWSNRGRDLRRNRDWRRFGNGRGMRDYWRDYWRDRFGGVHLVSRMARRRMGVRCGVLRGRVVRKRRGGLRGVHPQRRQFFLQILGGDLVESAGSDLGVADAHFLGSGKDHLALETEFAGDVVNANGHRKSI